MKAPASPNPSIIRASEIGQWTYCQRAWWLARQGHSSSHAEALQAGVVAHESHVRQVASAQRKRGMALWLLALGTILLIAALALISIS